MEELELRQSLDNCYGNASDQALSAILQPVQIPICSIDKTIVKLYGHAHWRAHFEVPCNEHIVLGCRGKFLSAVTVEGRTIRREIAKGKVISVDEKRGLARGEIYTGTPAKSDLAAAMEQLADGDYFEIDPYGTVEKIQRALSLHHLIEKAKAAGCRVEKAVNCECDLIFEKAGVKKRITLKNLSHTNPDCAQLVQNSTNDYFTKSCSFEGQDIFAVSLLARTGKRDAFLFARSVSELESPEHGLPCSSNYVDYATQNPVCRRDDKVWFETLDAFWK